MFYYIAQQRHIIIIVVVVVVVYWCLPAVKFFVVGKRSNKGMEVKWIKIP